MEKSHFDGLMVTLASPENIAKWSFGSVDSPDNRGRKTHVVRNFSAASLPRCETADPVQRMANRAEARRSPR